MAKIDYTMHLSKTTARPEKGSLAYYAARYDSARKNLVMVLICTVINLVLLLAGSEMYLLFSATVPYFIPAMAVIWELGTVITAFGYGISLICLIFYVVAWLFSKNRTGWMTFALVLFVLDTAFLVFLIILLEDVSAFLTDIGFHIWVLYYLITGVAAAAKLKRMEAELPPAPEEILMTGPELE